MEVIVYSTPTCPYCHMVKDFLKDKNVQFKDLDVSEDKDALQEMMSKSGQTGVPVLDINGKILIGFDESAIREALDIKD